MVRKDSGYKLGCSKNGLGKCSEVLVGCKITTRWAHENEDLVARFGYCLKRSHWKVDAPIYHPGEGGGVCSELV